MPFFIPVPTGEGKQKPYFYSGCYAKPHTQTGHTLEAPLQEYLSWLDENPTVEPHLDQLFRIELLKNQSWREWRSTLSAHDYSEMIAAAIIGSWEEAQALYDNLKGQSTPGKAAAEWQAIADLYRVDLTF